MTTPATKVYPHGLATLTRDGRASVVEHAVLGETSGGVLEGAPTPELDARLRLSFCASVQQLWGRRANHVVEPERVEIPFPGRVIRRMPAIACAA